MPIPIASRLARIPRPATLAINARIKNLQRSGSDIINLSVGEPDCPTPERIGAAAIRAIGGGHTRYTEVQGIPELRQAIAARTSNDYGISVTPEEVIVSNGGKQGLYNLFQCLIEPGDEILIPTPCWLSYPPQVMLAQGVPVLVPMPGSTGFRLDIQRLDQACTSKTKAVVINSPSNPTGVAYDVDSLRGLADLAQARNLVIISDDLYYRMVYDGFRFQSIASLSPDARDRTVIIGGLSKVYAMTGWRIGFTVASRPLISAMSILQGQSTSNPCTISQYAGLEALNGSGGDEEVVDMVARFCARRDRILENLADIPGVPCVTPQGAFYVFPDLSAYYQRRSPSGRVIANSVDMAGYLVEEAGLAGVPGAEFFCDNHLRFSYACSIPVLDEGMLRLKKALNRLQ